MAGSSAWAESWPRSICSSYPALTYLEEIGHAAVEADGARKLYRITDSGQEHLESNRSMAEALFTRFVRVGERMDRVRRAMHAQETEEDISADRGGSRFSTERAGYRSARVCLR